jgi:hypothetical protein
VGVDKAAAGEMIRISNARSVPVIVIGGEVIIGFDRTRIDAALGL